jgi:D-alanyl-D-alanine carboxypeptidase (penicillin-binding protein 5/6)
MHRIVSALVLVCIAARALAGAPEPPEVDAKSYFLIDASSGAVLAHSRSDEQLDPASLTKLMTAYLTFGALARGEVTLDDRVPVSEKAWRAPGSRMFIEVGSEVALSDLLRGLIIQSGNDAAIALAEYVAGSNDAFVEQMNETAGRLGMTGTSYRNANGLPARGHVSTTHDTAILARALIEEFPQFYSIYSEREFTFNQITQHNRNALLWRDSSVDGLKTGYTSAAGYCLVSSAERDGMRLIAVIFGSSSADARTDSSMALLDYGFDAFETHRLYARGENIAEARVYKGNRDTLPIGAAEDVFVTVPRGEYASLVASAALTTDLVAPLQQDQTVGELEVSLNDAPVVRMPLVALEEVRQGWLPGRIADGVALWFD